MLASETFQEAKKIVTFEGWTKGTLATNDRYPVDVEDPEAKSFCMIGAMMKVSGRYTTELDGYLSRVLPSGHFGVVASFNDSPETTLDDVVDVFDRATILAKGSGN